MGRLYIKVRLNEKEKDVLRHLPKDTAEIVEKLILNNRELQKNADTIKNLQETIKLLKQSIDTE